MAMGREGSRQDDLMVTWAEMPRSPGHVCYDRLQDVLIAGGFDRFVETACQPYYAPKMGAPSVPPGRYFRMHMVGYFEGIASERGIAWRCSDSMSLRDFLRLENREKVPITRGCRRRAGGFPMRSTRRCSAGCYSLWPSKAWSRASGSASMPRRWRPMPRCARSCAGTMAEPIAQC